MKNRRLVAIVQVLLASAMFGAIPPLAKLLLGEIQPIPLAGFLYLGSGLGLLFMHSITKLGLGFAAGAPLTKKDVPWLAGAIIAGGIVGPIILMYSLRITPAATAALLLNFEAVATAVIALLVFRETIGVRIWASIGCITLAAILLSFNPAGGWGFSLGALGIITACTLWGLDNNLTRNISAKDPVVIVSWKGLCAGIFTLLLALALGIGFPAWGTILKCLLLGAFGFGLSLVLFILAMRSLGAARTTVLFGSAPFMGALLSWLIFHDALGGLFKIALTIMVVGVVMLLSEKYTAE